MSTGYLVNGALRMPKRALHAKAKNDSRANGEKGAGDTGASFALIRDTTLTARLVTWGIVVGSVFLLIVGVRCIGSYSGGGTSSSSNPFPAPTVTTEPIVGGGMFPDAPVRAPIITGVECPPDSIQITVGNAPADTVCVRGRLADTPYSETSSIAIPPLTWGSVCNTSGCTPPVFRPCLEDERVDTITGECIHVDRIAPVGTATPTPTQQEGGNTTNTNPAR